jgi:hypothetical protein
VFLVLAIPNLVHEQRLRAPVASPLLNQLLESFMRGEI